VRYFTIGRTAVLAQGFLLALAVISLFVFAASVAAFVRRTAGEAHALPGLTLGGGVLKLFRRAYDLAANDGGPQGD